MKLSNSNGVHRAQDHARAILRVLALGMVSLAACEKTPPATMPETPSQTKRAPDTYEALRNLIKTKGLSPDKEKVALQNVDDMQRQADQAVLDREELVASAPPDFKPEAAKHKIRLTLTVEKAIIRRNETPRFRLELTNVGSEPVAYTELQSSFFKTGALSASRDIQFLLIPPSGKKIALYTGALGSGSAQEIVFPSDWSTEKKSLAVKEMNSRSKAESTLSVKLLPGETLRTRGDLPGDPFRTLTSNAEYSETGTYRMRARFDKDFLLKRISPWMSPAQKDAARKRRAEELMMPVDSNEARFEVAR